jgi:hypothetical protein
VQRSDFEVLVASRGPGCVAESTGMSRRAPRLVVTSYVVLGAFGVHAIRYALASGRGVHPAHGYLAGVPPLLAGVLALALARFAFAAIDQRATASGPLDWRVRWLSGTLGFLALYAVQENAEAMTATGHLAGPLALIAHGGWTVVPLGVIAGGVLAVLLRGTEAALERLAIAFAGGRPRSRVLAALTVVSHCRTAPSRRAPELARNVAGRAPPLAS